MECYTGGAVGTNLINKSHELNRCLSRSISIPLRVYGRRILEAGFIVVLQASGTENDEHEGLVVLFEAQTVKCTTVYACDIGRADVRTLTSQLWKDRAAYLYLTVLYLSNNERAGSKYEGRGTLTYQSAWS